MSAPIPTTELEIIGYANRLTDSMLPAVVPPVFRVRSEPSRILIPPFSLRDGVVSGATEVSQDEIQALSEAGELTLLPNHNKALPDHEMWIDLDGVVHYEPIRAASAGLKALAINHFRRAKEALIADKLDEAENLCRIALRADDRLMEPLAISAAISRHRNNQGNVRLMKKVAEGYLSEEGFDYLVNGFSNLLSAVPVTGELCDKHKISGMAAIKPKAHVNAAA